MITYTVDETRELGIMFELFYPNSIDYNISVIEDILKSGSETHTVIKDFLGGSYALAVTQEGADIVYGMVFDTALEEMPLYMNDPFKWKRAIANWRLKIGK